MTGRAAGSIRQDALALSAVGLLTKVAAGRGGCWLWTAATTNGYGVVSFGGRLTRAHRASYVATRGPIPDDRPHLDHLCRTRACIRPDHLEAVTQAENNRRMGLAITHCPKNHPLPPREPGKRRGQCKECRSEYDRQRWAAGREGVQSNAPAVRTHCPQGHPYDEANTYVIPSGGRACRACRNEASRRYRSGDQS